MVNYFKMFYFLVILYLKKTVIKACKTNTVLLNDHQYKVFEPFYSNCGIQSNKPLLKRSLIEKIINGDTANSNSWPWIVSIRIFSQHLCAGVLISNEHVLTAAHCFVNSKTYNFSVIVGLNNLFDKINLENKFDIDYIKIHPEYDSEGISNDIAVLKLSKPVNFSSNISAICLPTSTDDTLVYDQTVYVAGWGSTTGINSPQWLSNQLLQSKLQVKNQDANICRRNFPNYYCAVDMSGNNSNICFGDSGGPMMYKINKKWYTYGIAIFTLSNSSRLCNGASPGYFTMIPNYLEWISNVLNNSSTIYQQKKILTDISKNF